MRGKRKSPPRTTFSETKIKITVEKQTSITIRSNVSTTSMTADVLYSPTGEKVYPFDWTQPEKKS